MGRPVTVTADVYLQDGGRTESGRHPDQSSGNARTYRRRCQLLFPGGRVLNLRGYLFQESVGRTDFPTGSMSTLVRSVKEKLFTLPEER